MMFRGRQIAHTELGKAVLDRVAGNSSPTSARSSRTPSSMAAT